MKPRVQLDHALFDVDFNSKPQIKTLQLKFGALARLWYFDITLDLSRATNAEIDLDLAIAMAKDIGIKDPSALVSYCISKSILIAPRPGVISSERVVKDQESLAEKREKWRRSKLDSNEILNGIQLDSQKSVNVHKCEDLNTEDLNTESKSKETANLPESLSTEAHMDALRRWAKYTKKLGKPLDQLQMETLALNWAGRPKELILGINQSIERGYRKIIYEPPDTKPPNASKNSNEKPHPLLAKSIYLPGYSE